MPWTIPDHKASAEEAIARGIISGKVTDLAKVPEPQQSSEHQARVASLSILNEVGAPDRVVTKPWAPNEYPPVIVVPPPVEPPVDPPPTGDWGDGKGFGSRPEGGVIHLRNESDIVIDNKFFEGRWWMPNRGHNEHVCILLENCTNITVRNCDFENVSEPVAVIGGSNILVEYTRTRGIVGPGSRVDEQTGNFLQTVGQPSNVRIRNNKIVATTAVDPWNGQYHTMTEDVISLFSASNCLVEFNQIDATGYSSDSGTGIIAGDANGDNHVVRGNSLLNPGQVGLATAGGFGHRFYDNVIWKDADQNPGSGNTAAYFWGYNGNAIGDGRYEGNRAKWNGGGGFWNPGGAVNVGNDWDDDSLNRDDLVITL